MNNHNIWVVIPASGIGSRMESEIPKQYLPFLTSTVIEQTLDRLLSFKHIQGAIVVLNESDQFWDKLSYQNKKPVITTLGDKERSGSVFNGLKTLVEHAAKENLWVMIHDAVRPCVSHIDLMKLVEQYKNNKAGLFLAHPVTDTIKDIDSNGSSLRTVDRTSLWRAFTPQMFPVELITRALQEISSKNIAITDDVSAIEYLNLKPKAILGQSDNIKITYPQDLLVAEVLLKNQ